MQHQGKVTGSLSFLCWMAVAGLKECEGWLIQHSGYTAAVAIAGLPPLLSFFVLLAFWKRSARPAEAVAAPPVPATVSAASAGSNSAPLDFGAPRSITSSNRFADAHGREGATWKSSSSAVVRAPESATWPTTSPSQWCPSAAGQSSGTS